MKKIFSRSGYLKKLLSVSFLVAFGGSLPLWGIISYPSNSIVQQQAMIKGRVVDTTGEPLIGVSVLVKGTTTGVITDLDGGFVLKASPGQVIKISYVGYATQEIKIKDTTPLSITMQEDTQTLKEVVVVGYGKQDKMSVTGAISEIKNGDIRKAPSPNLIESLAGRLPGLTTIQAGSLLGDEGYSIYLRGASTTNGQSPLILVDGVPRSNLSSLDPHEVATVSVLKDASATAVFGVRGANGVILITTITGKKEKPELSVSAEFAIRTLPYLFHSVDSRTFAEMRNLALENDGLPTKYSERQLQYFSDGTNYYYPNTDWTDILYRKAAFQSRYNVNLTGGTDRVNYFVNVSYLTQGSNIKTLSKKELGYDPTYKYNRFNFRTNLDITVNDWIKADVNVAGYINTTNRPRADIGYTFHYLYLTPPTLPGPVSPEGLESEGVEPGIVMATNIMNTENAYGQLNYKGYVTDRSTNLQTTAALEFNLSKIVTEGLSTKVMASFDNTGTENITGTKAFTVYRFAVEEETDPVSGGIRDVATWNLTTPIKYFPLTVNREDSKYNYNLNLQWMLNYNRTFAVNHAVSGMIMAQYDNAEAESTSGDGLLPYNRIGVSGRATYAYKGRYMAEFNIGYNGSEQFAPGKRFGVFPAGSIGWVISREKFMENIKPISFLKLRASYGKVGNDNIGSSRFLYMDNYQLTGSGTVSSLGSGKYYNEVLIGNPNLTWEVAYKQNYGLELEMFNKELFFNVDVFHERREQILITRGTVPTIFGRPLSVIPKANIGKVNNKGYELELGYRKSLNKDLSFSVRGTLSYVKNKVIYLDETSLGSDYVCPYRTTGYSMDQNFGYLIDWDSPGKGYFTSQEEIDSYKATYEGVQPRPGDFVYKDMNGDGVINTKDEVPIGYSKLPRITYGLNLSFHYKGFDISALFQGIGKASVLYSGKGVYENQADGFYAEHMFNSWTKERYESGQKIEYPALTTVSSSSLRNNDYFIQDRSYLRLKNAEIGYTLPASWCNKLGFRSTRIYLNGSNLLTISNLTFKYLDPEQWGPLTIPVQRVFNLGIDIKF